MNKIQRSGASRYFEPTFYLVFCAVFAFLLWKCRYGMACYDEPFYLTIPFRLIQGDSLFVHEWHLSQMSAVLLYPFVSLFLSVTGSTEGIVLAFRYFYTVIQAAVSLFFYYRLKPIHRSGAAIASLGFLIYAPFGIMALSYNSLGILCLSMAVVIYITAKTYKPFQYVLAGLFLAGSVLCCPYLVLVYIYMTLAVAFLWFFRKDTKHLKSWFCVTVGCALAALAFTVFVLHRISLSRILETFPELFRDPEHENRSFLYVFATSFYYMARGSGIVSLLAACAGLVALWFARRNRDATPKYYIIGAVLTLILTIPFATYHRYPNFLMYPINLFALYCLVLAADSRCRELFWKAVVPGFIYAFCIHWSSNQKFHAMTSALSVSFPASVLIVVLTAEKILADYPIVSIRKTNLIAAVLTLLMVFQIGAELFVRYDAVFWEAPMPELTYPIQHGPEKGILASEEPGMYYDKYYSVISTDERYQEAESVLFLALDTWMYLIGNKQISSYSAWLSGVCDKTSDRLNTYYQLNPEKLPDYVFLHQDNLPYAEAVFADRGYTREQIAEDCYVFMKSGV